jgi:type I restriction enzyme S subunit
MIRPSDRIASAFEDIAKSLFDRIELNARQARTLAALRDLLIPRLMSGEIRVDDADRLIGNAGA